MHCFYQSETTGRIHPRSESPTFGGPSSAPGSGAGPGPASAEPHGAAAGCTWVPPAEPAAIAWRSYFVVVVFLNSSYVSKA